MKRLAVVVLIALVGFAGAFVVFRGEAEQGCLSEAPRDASYAVEFEEAVRMDEKTHVLLVSRDGNPVTGARVCLNLDMSGMGMSGMGLRDEAEEVSAGRYEVLVNFAMGGPWSGTVLIEEQDGRQVTVPIAFDVLSPQSVGGES